MFKIFQGIQCLDYKINFVNIFKINHHQIMIYFMFREAQRVETSSKWFSETHTPTRPLTCSCVVYLKEGALQSTKKRLLNSVCIQLTNRWLEYCGFVDDDSRV